MDTCPICGAPIVQMSESGDRACIECDWSEALTDSIPDDPEAMNILHKEHIL